MLTKILKGGVFVIKKAVILLACCALLAVLGAALPGCGPTPARSTGTPGLKPGTPLPTATVTATATVSATQPLQLPGDEETSPPGAMASVASPTLQQGDATFDALAALLPDDLGHEWLYYGTAEYAHTMRLDSLRTSALWAQFDISGKVSDMSGGASGLDHALTITYTISDGVLRQHSTGAALLDSPFSDLELLRVPLQKGAKWTQTAVDADGKPVTLDCAITAVDNAGGRNAYTVEYYAQDGSILQRRTITQGQGVTLFERRLGDPEDHLTVGYYLRTVSDEPSMDNLEDWLPQLGKTTRYVGLAEYSHRGALTLKTPTKEGAIYIYRGQYTGGKGDESKFAVEYTLDKLRGTLTEHVVNSGQKNSPNINSRLHNLVLIRLPLEAGATWSHSATLGGQSVTVVAQITELDRSAGTLRVRYSAHNVPGYYDNTYVEQRTFQKGRGMTAFSCLLEGDIGLSAADAQDAGKVEAAIAQHSFGYTLQPQ